MISTPTSDAQLTWMDGFKVLLAVMTFGIGWFANNQTTVIAYAALVLVFLVGAIAKRSEKYKWLAGKGPLTIAVFVVSFVLSYLFQPFVLPAAPAWTGDAGTFMPLFSAWLSASISIVGAAVLYAMSVYNVLLAKVLEKLPPALQGFLK